MVWSKLTYLSYAIRQSFYFIYTETVLTCYQACFWSNFIISENVSIMIPLSLVLLHMKFSSLKFYQM